MVFGDHLQFALNLGKREAREIRLTAHKIMGYRVRKYLERPFKIWTFEHFTI